MTEDILEQQLPGCRILEFTRDSFLNSALVDASTGETVYTIHTQIGTVSGMRTSLQINDSEIVSITKGAILQPDNIAFKGREPMKIKDWIRERTFSDFNVAQTNDSVIRYMWANAPNSPRSGTISLCAQHIPDHPIAWFYASVASDPPRPAKVIIHPDAFIMQDAVIASLLADEYVDRSAARVHFGGGRPGAAPLVAAMGHNAYLS
ncbi:hypothetical protein BXZ70DRAFT_1024217 [Cristinia sonorae]|uniref:DUF6593 domain-containing protein n=1 Tax=Cristinia sonorae TaxID=1940300 RepID=A0A8K0UNY3_9AGAR|nr:hypothetical protein BXZ70DRAFT_1024217 [Cristinia sonorae]